MEVLNPFNKWEWKLYRAFWIEAATSRSQFKLDSNRFNPSDDYTNHL